MIFADIGEYDTWQLFLSLSLDVFLCFFGGWADVCVVSSLRCETSLQFFFSCRGNAKRVITSYYLFLHVHVSEHLFCSMHVD